MALRVGLWTIDAPLGPTRSKVFCKCDCGTERYVSVNILKYGRSKSCGCVVASPWGKSKREVPRTHGMSKSREFQAWMAMRRRCYDPRRPDFASYGGRGIGVCDEWLQSFERFYEDMGDCPEGHTLDRSDNTQGYNKNNCVWATKKQQARNRGTNRIVDVSGEEMTMVEASERYGVHYPTVKSRLKRGWSIEKALTTPVANFGGARSKYSRCSLTDEA